MAFRPLKDHYKARVLDFSAGLNVILLNEADARENGLYIGDRAVLARNGKQLTTLINISNADIKRGEIGLFRDVSAQLGAKDGDSLLIGQADTPASVELIKKKMDGGILDEREMNTIIGELTREKLSDVELASFITSLYIRGLTIEETVFLTRAVVNSGETLDLGKAHPIVDKHCTGGVAGNRTTMLIVPIVAAAGLYMPKTSSRSITSAAGTADTMEVLAPVELSIADMRDIVLKTHGCIAWGGAMNLAAADDKLIKIRHPMSLDPKGVMVASVLAKKKSVGAEYVVIDIPVGRGAKIPTMDAANDLAREFIVVSERLGMRSEVLVTDGRDPIGAGIGPGLECRDVLNALQCKGPTDLTQKSCKLAGAVMEMCGKVEQGRGYAVALNLLQSGKAYKKMKEIIAAQGGNPNVKPHDIKIGHVRHKYFAESDGRIHIIDNKKVNMIARAAGAPESTGAGLVLAVESGDKVKKGQLLYEMYAESEAKLSYALKLAEDANPVELDTVILGKMMKPGVLELKPKD